MATQDFFRVGELLRNQERQYAVQYEAETKTWMIVDLWHESLRELAPSDEIPRDSTAVTRITEVQFTMLLTEADRLGLLARFNKSAAGGQGGAGMMGGGFPGNPLGEDFSNPMDPGPVDLSGEGAAKDTKRLVDSRHEVRMKALDVISQMVAGDDTGYLSSF